MKKAITLSLIFISFLIKSQAPQSINYQAIARDGSGNIVTTAIGIKFQIYQGSLTGTLVYEETNTATPSAAGVFTVHIGGGSPVIGNFNTIGWGAGPYFLQVNIDPSGGTSYSNVGASQLVSVPYAFFAEKAGNVTNYTSGSGIAINSGSIINTAPGQTVNIGAAGISTVTGTYPNYTVGVAPPALSYNTGTKELTLSQGGTNTTATLTGTGSSTISMMATGIASVTPTGAGNNFTVSVQSPVIVGQGGTTVMGVWPNFTVTSSNTAYTAGTGITIAGNIITNTAPNQTVNINGVGSTTVTGTYPNYTIAGPTPTITPPPSIFGAGVATVTPAGNNFTVNVAPVNLSYVPGSGVLTYAPAPGSNTINLSPALGFTNNTLGVGSNTIIIPGSNLWTRPTLTATTLNNSGDFVGIGLFGPTTKLHIQDSSAATILSNFSGSPKTAIRIHNDNTTNNNFSSLIFSTQNTTSGSFESSKIIGVNTNHTSGSVSGDLAFMTRNPSNIFERMRLTSSGNLGVGTTTPQQILHLLASFNNVGLAIEAGGAGRARLGLLAGGVDNGEIGYTNHLTFGSISNSSLAMVTEWMRITNSGNVGIGTTLPSQKLDISGKIRINDATQGAGKVLTSDASGTGTWNYPLSPIKSGAGSGISILNNNAYTYDAATILTITPAVSGTVLFQFQADYNFQSNISSQVNIGIYINTTGVAPNTSTPLTWQNSAGFAIPPTGGGYGDIPINVFYSMAVTAGTTYYVWYGANDVNFTQTSCFLGIPRIVATLHQASGL